MICWLNILEDKISSYYKFCLSNSKEFQPSMSKDIRRTLASISQFNFKIKILNSNSKSVNSDSYETFYGVFTNTLEELKDKLSLTNIKGISLGTIETIFERFSLELSKQMKIHLAFM